MTPETPVERRLREMVETRRSVERGRTTYDGDRWMPEHVALTQAIDAGREALALLRRLEPACYNAASWTAWKAEVASVIARCGGQEGT